MLNPLMQYSTQGTLVTQTFENCKLTPYQDIRGVWTDGWGNTHNVVPYGPPITQEQADAQLQVNLQSAVNAVNAGVDVPLTQGEFDALVDFTFNCGIQAFLTSTMLRYLNAENYDAAANQFDLWDHASGQVVAGLLRRRNAEVAEFKEGEDDGVVV